MKHLAVLVILSSFAMPAVAGDASPFEVRELAANLHMLSTDQGEYTTNTLVFFGDDGLLLVDTQSETEAEALKQKVDAYGMGAPRYIINTHRHVEHIGGNAAFGEAPIVIAHALVPGKLRSRSHIFNEYPPATYPDTTVSDTYTLDFNGERIVITAMGGSHDDNEIIVHFTRAKVVHLSSLVNGFNFPSIDRDGDALEFPELVGRAIELLPHDVVIVSGHNDTGTWQDLNAYRDMLERTIEIVRAGLAEGKDVATLQAEKVLAEWDGYAGSYVSTDEWIETVARRIRDGRDERDTPHVPLFHAWKERGAGAAVTLFRELRRDGSGAYAIDEFVLLGIGDKLLTRGLQEDAVVFLTASLEEYPEAKYNYYVHHRLAEAHGKLGAPDLAVRHCEAALELKPDFEAAAELLKSVKGK